MFLPVGLRNDLLFFRFRLKNGLGDVQALTPKRSFHVGL